MVDVLKGNFPTKKTVTIEPKTDGEASLEERFEREALKRLGGSVAFVSKKKVTWSLDEEKR